MFPPAILPVLGDVIRYSGHTLLYPWELHSGDSIEEQSARANPAVNITAITARLRMAEPLLRITCRFCKTFPWEDEKCCLPPISVSVCIRIALSRARAGRV
jgi:hypothetical protein